jgi:hypothetical protein
MNDPLKTQERQHQLDTCNVWAMNVVEMYASGLVTLSELTEKLIEIRAMMPAYMNGLICPVTGLRLDAEVA